MGFRQLIVARCWWLIIGFVLVGCTSATPEFTGDVDQSTSNQAPQISASCSAFITQDLSYTCTPSYSDADGDMVSWHLDSAVNTCAWASVNIATGEVSGTPNDNMVGACVLAFYAFDGAQSSGSISFGVTVINSLPNLSLSNPSSLMEDQGATVLLSDAMVQASEEGFGNYVFSSSTTSPLCSDNATTLSINNSSGEVVFQPLSDWNGDCYIKVQFDDGNAGVIESEVMVTVLAVNDAPVASANCAATGTVGEAYSCSASSLDVDGPSLSWTLTASNTCAWALIDGAGQITGTPTLMDTCDLAFQSYDGVTFSNEIIQSLTISLPPLAVLQLSETSPYDYGSRPVGSSTEHIFTLTNTGAEDATSLSGGGLAAPFSYKGGSYPGIGGNCGLNLNMGSDCTIVIVYEPTGLGFQNDTVVIDYYDGYSAQSADRDIQGVGVNPAVLSISDGPTYDYGTFIPGAPAVTRLFTITNSGDYAATGMGESGISSPFQFTGGSYPGTGGSCGAVLSGGGSTCTIEVRYTPGAVNSDSDTIEIDYESGVGVLTATRAVQATVVSPTVAALYPTYGSNWNDYIRNNNGGTNVYDQPDTQCTGAEVGTYHSCIHGGEKRKVVAHGFQSCAGLSLFETLDVFEWECVVLAGKATFVTKGLKNNKGLRDLIDFASPSWLNNGVTIFYSASPIASSVSGSWWSNAVTSLPDNSAAAVLALDGVDNDSGGPDQAYSSGTILVLNSNRDTGGYNINMDRLAVVTNANATLRAQSGMANNVNNASGETTGVNKMSIIGSGGQKFLWIEGNFAGDETTPKGNHTILFYNVAHSHIRHTKTYFSTSISGNSGLSLVFSNKNLVRNYQAAYHQASAIILTSSNYNLFDHIMVNNNGFNLSLPAIQVQFPSSYNVLTNLLVASNYYSGLNISGSNNTVSHVTSMNNGSLANADGIAISATNNVLTQFISTNNSGVGIKLSAAHGARIAAGFSRQNNSSGISDTASSTATNYSGMLFVDTCSVSGTAGVSGSCANTQLSTANIDKTSSLSSGSTFVGKVTVDDSENFWDSAGVTNLSNLYYLPDYLNFQNIFRFWGPATGSVFPAFDHRGICLTTNCQIMDARIQSADTILRNVNGAFSNAANCPSSADGNKTISDYIGNTFLINASELLGDARGDEDGLCESNEACVYSPHLGFYQGEGDPRTESCTFSQSGGSVSGVQMFGYPDQVPD